MFQESIQNAIKWKEVSVTGEESAWGPPPPKGRVTGGGSYGGGEAEGFQDNFLDEEVGSTYKPPDLLGEDDEEESDSPLWRKIVVGAVVVVFTGILGW